MSDSELHEATFDWYHPEAEKVVITGIFDNWSGSTPLQRIANGWETKVKLPWGQKILYKYIVDGRWTSDPTKAIEYDHEGNANNVYESPPKPGTAAASTGETGVVQQAKETVANAAQSTHENYITPAIAAVAAAVPIAAVAGTATKEVEPAPEAAPLVDAAAAMPPSTPQKTLEQAKAAVQAVQEKISPTVETSDAKGVELHSKEGPAAPLHDAAESMPSAAQDAAKSATETVQNALPEGTTERVKAAGETVSTKAGEAAALAAGAAAGAGATVAAAIPDEHKQKVEENVIKPVKEAVSSAVPEGKTNGDIATASAGGALAYVASGVGAAIKTVTGVDPINVDKIPVETPKTEFPPAQELPAKVMEGEQAPVGTEENPTVAMPAEPLKMVDGGATVAKETPVEPLKAEGTQPEVSTHIPVNVNHPAASAADARDGIVPATTADEAPVPPAKEEAKPTPAPDTTKKEAFPSVGETSAATSSPAKSEGTRKKRLSFFGKIKEALHHHKDRKTSNPN